MLEVEYKSPYLGKQMVSIRRARNSFMFQNQEFQATWRELEILGVQANLGLTDDEIGTFLGISSDTVTNTSKSLAERNREWLRRTDSEQARIILVIQAELKGMLNPFFLGQIHQLAHSYNPNMRLPDEKIKLRVPWLMSEYKKPRRKSILRTQ
jgi:hypothetical protein